MRVLVTDPLSAAGLAVLRARHDVVEAPLPPDELVKEIGGYDALVVRSATKVTRPVLLAGTRLKVVGRAGVGVDNIDVVAAKERGIVVVNAPSAPTNAVAELALGQMLALARRIVPGTVGIREGRWEKSKLEGIELSGKTLGLLGLGRIGSRVAELSRAFGMRALCYDPYITDEKARAAGVVRVASVESLVAESDFVSVHVALTPETRHLVGAKLLARFRPGSYLLNLSRGGVVDEAALVRALDEGRLAGAALDVFEKEPPGAAPIAQHPLVVATPHLGASTAEAQEAAGRIVAEDVVRVLDGTKPEFAV
ncbi:MAG: hydroxyacid dehydrogenase [Methanobacteriota archaeon]